ncbi:MAG: ComF family protein [Dysgonamonadaceae bacterium]|nr:ComF family protein [Dysgonamonadaceae bacterium]
MKMNIINLITNFVNLFYPKLCVVCGEPLLETENYFCLECFLKLPKTNYHRSLENKASDRFAGKILLEKACAYLYYNKGGIGQALIAEIKYRGNRDFGEWIGAFMAAELADNRFFDGIDYLVPVPLHRSKERKRGFNQAEKIACGIAQATGIPLNTDNVFRKKANTTQTKKGLYERWENTRNLFEINNPDVFAGKHILIVDDVLTTGSTLEAVAQSLLKSPGIRISILTLAIA